MDDGYVLDGTARINSVVNAQKWRLFKARPSWSERRVRRQQYRCQRSQVAEWTAWLTPGDGGSFEQGQAGANNAVVDDDDTISLAAEPE